MNAWLTLTAVAFLVTLSAATGPTGLLYALVYLTAVAPGVWLGRRLAGPGPAAWIVGATIGYGIAQLALWVPIVARVPFPVAFLVAWVMEAAIIGVLTRRVSSPVLVLPASAADLRALALTLLLVPAVMGLPYRNLGISDETGTRYYRAYFTADFVWHTALAAELGRYATPPRNPYMASEDLHYYWTYFLLPSVVAHEAPEPLADIQVALKANNMISALLLVGMLFLLTRAATTAASVAAMAVALGVLAASLEGTFVLNQLWRAGRPLTGLTDLNIDAITAWQFGGLRIDGLPRGLWYNPQHSFSCALGLVAMLIAATAGAAAPPGAIWLAGTALAFSTGFNPFVGGVFSLVYGLAIAADAARQPGMARTLVRHLQAAVPVALALVWCAANQLAEGAATAIAFGFRGFARNNTFKSLLLSTGPMLVPSLAGLWPWRELPARPAYVAVAGTTLSVLLMHFMTLSEASWVGFRTGQILLLMLPVLLVRVLSALTAHGAGWSATVAALILVTGIPTTAIDVYNAQDISNRRMGPGFHWTLPVTPGQQAAFAWIRQNLPEDAIVQMEPMVRGREHWSLIPTFAERRMSAGLPISLLPMPEYAEGSAEVQRIYQTTSPREAWQFARARGIRYLYVDHADRAAYPEGVGKFAADSAYFTRAFDNSEVSIYEVR